MVASSDGETRRSTVTSAMYGVLLVFIWWTTAVAVTVVIKQTLGRGDDGDGGRGNLKAFPYPFALTCLTNTCSGLISLVFGALVSELTRPLGYASTGHLLTDDDGLATSGNQTDTLLPPRPPMRRDEIARVILIGVIQGTEIACNNKSLEFLTVSSRTMLNSTSILFMMTVAYLFGLEQLGHWRLLAGLFLCLGAIFQGLSSTGETLHLRFSGLHGADVLRLWTEGQVQMQGVLLQVTAMIISAVRWAMLQIVLQHSPPESALGQLTKAELTSRVMPVTGAVCLVLALIFEAGAFAPERIFRFEMFVQVAIISSLIAALTLSELSLVRLTSAVAIQVLSALHQIPLILAGVFIFGDHVRGFGLMGFGFCVVGAMLYARARFADKVMEAETAHASCSPDEAADAERCRE